MQHLLGIESRMRGESRRRPDRANSLSVALELQADCFATLHLQHRPHAEAERFQHRVRLRDISTFDGERVGDHVGVETRADHRPAAALLVVLRELRTFGLACSRPGG